MTRYTRRVEKLGDSPANMARRTSIATYYIHVDGYEVWQSRYGDEHDSLRVHQLLAVANGADPYEVFGDSHIHHKNGVPWDNRPSNIEVLTHSEHSTHHAEKRWGDSPWRDEGTLRQMHIDEGMSKRHIAEKLGCDDATVRYWLNQYEIARNDSLPCGHVGIQNLGGGEYACPKEGCQARYTRADVEEVLDR